MKAKRNIIFSLFFYFIISILLVFLIVTKPIVPKQEEFKPDIELKLSIDKNELNIGDEVLISYEIKNNDSIAYKKGCYFIFLELKEKDKKVKLKIADLSYDISPEMLIKGVFSWKIEFKPGNYPNNLLNLAIYSRQDNGSLKLIKEESIPIKFI